MAKKVSWVVMGLGLQGQRLIRAIEYSRHATLAAVASQRERGSFARVLKDKQIDAVAIATPNHKHAKQVMAAARARKHVLCEKPLALSIREALAIQKAVRKNKIKLFVNYHLRMHPDAQKAQKIIASKKLGELTYIEMQWSVGGLAGKKQPPLPHHMRWRDDPKRAGGGTLTTRGVHLFDLLRYVTREEARRVRGWSDATKSTVDRTAVAIIELASGVPAVLTTSKRIPNADNRIVLHGTKGKAEFRDIFDESKLVPLCTKVLDSFAAACNGKQTNLATLDDGIAAVRIVEAFTKSAK